jgi:hypothetical protein
LISGILFIQKIYDHYVMFLAVPVAPSYSLLDPLGIPGQIVIHYEGTELEVDSFRPCLRCNQNFRLISEAVHQCSPHISRSGTRHPVGAFMFGKPFFTDFS